MLTEEQRQKIMEVVTVVEQVAVKTQERMVVEP
jgi:hypothetical protein